MVRVTFAVCIVISLILGLADDVSCSTWVRPPGYGLVSNTLGPKMVLQRAPAAARLWGWTSIAGLTVEVSFDSALHTTKSDQNGKWMLELPPKSAGGPFVIGIRAQDGETAVLDDVYFGDVYICSGQSNMQQTVSSAFNASQEIAKANNYPYVRVFTVGQATVSDTPLENLATITQRWSQANSQTIGGPDWAYFSALCWFFGRDLYDKYRVPIGLVSSNWGGTYVQAWMSPDALQKCAALDDQNGENVVASDVLTYAERSFTQSVAVNPNQPSVLYNAMIVPFLNMRMRGATWYQGESNVGNAKYYGCAFPAMISDWRVKWGYTDAQFPFFFVQLAAYTQGGPYGVLVAELRESQMLALALPYVGMASAVDLGDLASPYGNIHPRDKQTIGVRMVAAAQALVYGDRAVVYQGPTAAGAVVTSQPPNAAVVVNFNYVAQSPLVVRNNRCPAELLGTNECGWFQLQANNGQLYNATSTLVGQTVELRATLPAGTQVVGARYGFADWPVCTLYNAAGFPAPPFNLPARAGN